MKIDIVATFRFLTKEEGSRHARPIVTEFYRCPLGFDGKLFDCGIYLDKLVPVLPGAKITVPLEFVRPDLVKGRLSVGSKITIWESGITAEGIVEQILPD
jgi:hypothetical protein